MAERSDLKHRNMWYQIFQPFPFILLNDPPDRGPRASDTPPYSRAIASIGLNLAARRAGYVPNTNPTAIAAKAANNAVDTRSTG